MFIDQIRFWSDLKKRHTANIKLALLLAREGLSAEEIEFVIERYLGFTVDLNRIRYLLDEETQKGRKHVDLPLEVLKAIKRWREEKGHGFIKIGKLCHKHFGIYLSGMTVRRICAEIDELIKRKEEEQRKLERIEQANPRELSLKELVWYIMRKQNNEIEDEIKRRVLELFKRAWKLDILDVL